MFLIRVVAAAVICPAAAVFVAVAMVAAVVLSFADVVRRANEGEENG